MEVREAATTADRARVRISGVAQFGKSEETMARPFRWLQRAAVLQGDGSVVIADKFNEW